MLDFARELKMARSRVANQRNAVKETESGLVAARARQLKVTTSVLEARLPRQVAALAESEALLAELEQPALPLKGGR